MFSQKMKILIIFSSVCFILLGILVYSSPPSRLEVNISKEIQEEINEERPIDFSSPITFISILGNGKATILSVLGVALFFWLTSYKKEAAFVLLVFISDALNFVIKLIFNRPRPTADSIEVLQKFDHSSFPSGHVNHYVVFFGFLLVVILYRKIFSIFPRFIIAIFLIFLILTIPISRIYVGAHWFTDVIGGYLTGFIFLSIMLGFYFKGSTNDHHLLKRGQP